ncbi:MAG: hypothetical protein K5912_03275 [Alphaproteobacteria bacterium]|nr:hypothetical protein [Alphaproteobacteria bacterium]
MSDIKKNEQSIIDIYSEKEVGISLDDLAKELRLSSANCFLVRRSQILKDKPELKSIVKNWFFTNADGCRMVKARYVQNCKDLFARGATRRHKKDLIGVLQLPEIEVKNLPDVKFLMMYLEELHNLCQETNQKLVVAKNRYSHMSNCLKKSELFDRQKILENLITANNEQLKYQQESDDLVSRYEDVKFLLLERQRTENSLKKIDEKIAAMVEKIRSVSKNEKSQK